MFRSAPVKLLVPLAALALTHCMGHPDSEPGASEGDELDVASLSLSQRDLPFNPSQFTLVRGDFDGNGTKDLFFIGNGGDVHLRTSNGSDYGFYLKLLPADPARSLGKGKYLIFDQERDGKDDILYIANDGTQYRWKSLGNAIGPRDQTFTLPPEMRWSTGQFLPALNTGDWYMNVAFIGNDGSIWAIHYDQNGGGMAPSVLAGDFFTPTDGKYYICDFDGNKFDDYLFIGRAGDVHVLKFVLGSPMQYQKLLNAGEFFNHTAGQYHVADFNGDGKTDLYFITDAGNVSARLSNGSSYSAVKPLLAAGSYGTIPNGQYFIGDFDANKTSDLFYIGNTGDIHVRMSNGSNYWNYKKLLNAGFFGSLTSGMFE